MKAKVLAPLVATMLHTLAVNSSYAKDSQAPTLTIDASSLSENGIKLFLRIKELITTKLFSTIALASPW